MGTCRLSGTSPSMSIKVELVTMIGPNGAGKTTTVETIIGLNRKATGSVLFDGESILGSHP